MALLSRYPLWFSHYPLLLVPLRAHALPLLQVLWLSTTSISELRTLCQFGALVIRCVYLTFERIDLLTPTMTARPFILFLFSLVKVYEAFRICFA